MYKVLHLEKSDFFKKAMMDIVSEKGFKYISVETTKEALEEIKDNNISLIVTSILGSGENIEEFILYVNSSKYKNIPIIVVTGSSLDEDKKELINLGVSDYILKDDFLNEFAKHLDAIFQENTCIDALKNAKIAIIDDSKFDLFRHRDIITNYGINNVDFYLSGKELSDSGKKYDIYIVDVVLKNEFGKNLILSIRRNNIDASIIAVSSLDNHKLISSILDAGANHYIIKPLDPQLYISELKSNARVLVLRNKIKELEKELKEIK